jgi:methionine-rich copper-binding protein CopC
MGTGWSFARRSAAATLAVWLVGAIVATHAGAHAAYKASNPADESSMTQAPGEIWAEYTEPLQEGSWMKVFDPCGDQVDAGDVRVEGYRMYISMSGATQGTYKVTWLAASAIDPHTTKGTFVFTVTQGESCPGEEPAREGEPESGSDPGPDGGGDAPEQSSDDDAVSSDGAPVSSGDDSRSKVERDRDAGRNGSGSARSRDDRGDDEVLAQRETDGGAPADEPSQPGLLTGIPIGGLALALAIAAAIGAAGGFIYAGIMGYHRPT